jgi:hypothetical protein
MPSENVHPNRTAGNPGGRGPEFGFAVPRAVSKRIKIKHGFWSFIKHTGFRPASGGLY